jgi:hypothetical protein
MKNNENGLLFHLLKVFCIHLLVVWQNLRSELLPDFAEVRPARLPSTGPSSGWREAFQILPLEIGSSDILDLRLTKDCALWRKTPHFPFFDLFIWILIESNNNTLQLTVNPFFVHQRLIIEVCFVVQFIVRLAGWFNFVFWPWNLLLFRITFVLYKAKCFRKI